jgi:cell division septum initiation protein DivIVA
MPPRKLDELADILDDARDTVEELQYDGRQLPEKLDELGDSLEEAADTVDELEEEPDGATPRRPKGP